MPQLLRMPPLVSRKDTKRAGKDGSDPSTCTEVLAARHPLGSLADWQCPVQRLFMPPCSRTAMCLTLMVQADFIFEVAQADASPDMPLEY